MYELTRENIQNMALATLTDVWVQVDWEKVNGQRALFIWDEFTNKVRAAAMTTSNYEKFVDKLCRKMEVKSLKYMNIKEISDEKDEFKKAVVKMLRDETQILILKLRHNNQIRKEQAAINKKQKEDYAKANGDHKLIKESELNNENKC